MAHGGFPHGLTAMGEGSVDVNVDGHGPVHTLPADCLRGDSSVAGEGVVGKAWGRGRDRGWHNKGRLPPVIRRQFNHFNHFDRPLPISDERPRLRRWSTVRSLFLFLFLFYT